VAVKKYNTGFEWSYRDLLFTMMVAYMAMAAMALIITSKITKIETVSPGNILIEMTWDRTKNADVDLWVQAPGERAVGYSNKSSVVFNLLRDDLGYSSDPESRNHELAVGRGLRPGEYIVNVHLYSARDSLPFDARVTVTLDKKSHDQASSSIATVIAREKVTLTRNGEQLTAIRFTLDKNGDLVPGAFNKVFKDLRSDTASPGPGIGGPPR